MKKILYTAVIFLFTNLCVNAENLTFLKENYELQYAHKNAQNYINEYVRPSQNLKNWTNIITVHYFPETKSPEKYVNAMTSLILSGKSNMYMIKAMPEYNLISFSIVSMKNDKGYIEYNVLKAEPAKEGGIKVIQFAHKYKFNNKDEFVNAFEKAKRYNMKYINGLINLQSPLIKKSNFEMIK